MKPGMQEVARGLSALGPCRMTVSCGRYHGAGDGGDPMLVVVLGVVVSGSIGRGEDCVTVWVAMVVGAKHPTLLTGYLWGIGVVGAA